MYSTKKIMYEKLKHFCSYQERSQKEVEEKLRELKVDSEMADEIILSLLHENFLKEERYARSIARGKFRMNQWGKNKIKMHLKSSYISDRLISLAMTEIDDQEYRETILKLYTTKYNSFTKEQSKTKQQKSINYLMQKGYEYQEIMNVINKAEE